MSGYGNDPAGPPANNPHQPYSSMPPPSEYEQALQPAGPTQPVPVQVDRASKILYVTGVLGVLGAIVNLFQRDTFEAAMRNAHPTLTDSEISSRVTVSFIATIILSVAFAVLYYLCGTKMRQARNWARITPTVILGLSVFFGLLALGGGGGGTDVILQVVTLALGIAFLVFSWSKPSNGFFASAKRR